VEKILWAELGKLYKANGQFFGKSIFKTHLPVSEKHYAIGLSTNESERFQGFHEENTLFIFDEAPGVAPEFWDAMEGSMTSANAHFLAIGNPTVTHGNFFNAFKSSQYAKISISCLEHPNVIQNKQIIPGAVSREWIESRREEWGDTSALWKARVLGEFAEVGEDTLIHLAWVENANLKPPSVDGERILGVDVARFGDDSTVLAHWRGNHLAEFEVGNDMRTTDVSGLVQHVIRKHGIDKVGVDVIGIGAGVVDELKDAGVAVIEVNSAAKPIERFEETITFNNLRSQMWWQMRTDLEEGNISLMYDEELKEELTTPKYGIDSKGRVCVESKNEIKKRLGRSPDKADAAVYGNAIRCGLLTVDQGLKVVFEI